MANSNLGPNHPRRQSPLITAEQARRLLAYDEATGNLIWRTNRGPARAGYIAGGMGGDGYIKICLDRQRYQAHRVIWLMATGEWPPYDIDHKDLDRSNNRLSNLRPATRTQNRLNTRRPEANTSGFKGVCWDARRSVWRARIKLERREITLGSFASAEVAAAAYARAAELLAGEFARHDGATLGNDIRAALRAADAARAPVGKFERSDKTKAKLKAVKHTPEWNAKISAARKGQPGPKISPEGIERIRASKLGRKASPETLERMRAAAALRVAKRREQRA